MTPRARPAYDAGVRDAAQFARAEAVRLAPTDPAGAAALEAFARAVERNLTGWRMTDVLPANAIDLDTARRTRRSSPR